MVKPDKVESLYDGKIKIAFYENRHRYSLILPDGSVDKKWITSVTGATGMLDKSTALIIWAIRLSREFLNGNIFGEDGKFKIELTENVLTYLIDESHKQHKIKKDEGKSIGDQVHKWAEQYALGLNPPMPDDEKVLNGITAFLDLVETYKIEFLDAERIVYSKSLNCVGKMDCHVRLTWKGKRQVKYGDYKTNNWKLNKDTGIRESIVYPEARYQTGGYKFCFEEENGVTDNGRLIFAFDKLTGAVAIHDLDEEPDAYAKDVACFKGLLDCKKRDKELGWG